MKNIFYYIVKKIASCALFMATISIGTASCAGLYQPPIPSKLEKK